MKNLIINNFGTSITDNNITVGADIINPDDSIDRLYFTTNIKYKNEISERADTFLIATLFYAMREGLDIYIDGTISDTLIRNIERFQAAWLCWRPDRYRKVSISAKKIEEGVFNVKGDAIQTFSGGLDSTFTTFQHMGGKSQQTLTSAVMVHGFDIPLDSGDVYDAIFRRSIPILAEVHVTLFPLKTNFRELWHKDLKHWEDAFATGMVASMMFFSKNHSYGLIASSEPYNSLLLPWGSNPITDPLLSSDLFHVEHDAAEYTRGEKVAMVKDWQNGIDNLRVCWQGNDIRHNCCRCEKCIRTILNFKSIGAGVPKSFPLDITYNHILALRGLSEAHLNPMRQIVNEAKKHHITDDWLSAVEEMIQINEKDIQSGKVKSGQLPQVLDS
ncbi:hypothetical protein [Pragia fontium]|uniref:Uncharacterized protein n=1 Tax=Pragia fontium DSM 5563 = ATCC 49100 TaxID=1122977 RepID=A0AAJ5BG60_9GAMM|nr:hypothetical protein [Pragia fontium]SFC19003.1 hypothetical protein SAMN02745723_101609 [Pragia fontium DSM 5563 = ATCC 49100]VEJ53268.1 Uncharacterised protein [Pragia fontium]